MSDSQAVIITDNEEAILGLAAHMLRVVAQQREDELAGKTPKLRTAIPPPHLIHWAGIIEDVRARYQLHKQGAHHSGDTMRGDKDGYFGPPDAWQPDEAA